MAALRATLTCCSTAAASRPRQLLPVQPTPVASSLPTSSLRRDAPASRSALKVRTQAYASDNGVNPKRHAFLHDFCMSIPYGAVAIVAGLALFALGHTNMASVATVTGGTVAMASVLSLKEWKAGGSSSTYALTTASASAATAYVSYCGLAAVKGVSYVLAASLSVLSVAMSIFCVYNVMAGGNPPKKAQSAKP